MQHLLAWVDEEGNVFTWLNRWRLWSLQFALTWHPHGGGGSSISLSDARSMSLAQAMAWYGWIGKTREAEAAAIREASERAKRAPRG